MAQAQIPGKVDFQHNNKLLFYDKQDKPASSGTYEIEGKKGIIITINDTTEILVETKTENELVFLTADSIRIHLSK
ncbi:MAG: hypothetical protein ACXWDO_10590 [Bacteroidia bacterium]